MSAGLLTNFRLPRSSAVAPLSVRQTPAQAPTMAAGGMLKRMQTAAHINSATGEKKKVERCAHISH